MNTPKVTAKTLLTSLRRKYPDTAILAEVTMEDEEELSRVRTAEVRRYPSLRKFYEEKNFFCDAALPENYNRSTAITRRRIDALLFDGDKRTAVEIKISRADFFRDTEEKRSAWFKHTHRFVYLTPKGMVKPEEVPTNCGLWEYEDGAISITKRAKVNKDAQELPLSMVKYFAWRTFIAESKIREK